MGKYIPQEKLDEIRNSLDIVEVVEEYVKLERSGKNYRGLCPFHSEKEPSFTVSPHKQIYHCFGCNEGGNMFNFLMKFLNINFPQSVEILADKAGVELPKKSVSKEDKKENKIYRINKLAAKYYYRQLKSSHKARKYLHSRGFQRNILEKFGIGYAPEGWSNVIDFMDKKGYSGEVLEEAGLVIPREKRGWYDRFRNRVIFPIFDISSRVIGFGARAMNNSTPKYINSPETKVYSKRKHLYGLNFAKNEIRKKDEVVVVEGYTDVLSLYQNGIKNVVSNLGTALTKQHIRGVRRFTDNVIVIYDSDEAGKLASLRNLDLLIEEGARVKLTCLPSGKDPDDYVGEFGKKKMLKIIAGSKDLIDYKLDILNYKSNSKNIHKKKEIIEDILSTIGKVNDSVVRSGYLNRLSDISATGIEERILREKLNEVMNSFNKYRDKDKIKLNIDKDKKISNTEKLLLRGMLESEKAINLVKEKLTHDDLDHPMTKKIVKKVFSLKEDKEELKVEKVMNHIKDEKCSRLLAKIFSEFESMPKHLQIVKDCIKSIELNKLNSQLSNLKQKIKIASSDKKKVLLSSYSSLCKEIKYLKENKIR